MALIRHQFTDVFLAAKIHCHPKNANIFSAGVKSFPLASASYLNYSAVVYKYFYHAELLNEIYREGQLWKVTDTFERQL